MLNRRPKTNTPTDESRTSALLPSQGVRWETAGERSAHDTLTEVETSTSLLFTFDERGLIEMVSTKARGRTVGDEIVPTPWRGRFWNYGERGGMLVPLEAEVAWVLPEGEKPYWRGHIAEISYELARGDGYRRGLQQGATAGIMSKDQARDERVSV